MEVTAAVKVCRNTPIRAHTNTQGQTCKTISLWFLKQYEHVTQSKLKLYKTILLYLTIRQSNQIRQSFRLLVNPKNEHSNNVK